MNSPLLQQAVEAPSDQRILHVWDTHVGSVSETWPLSDKDKLAFARAVLAIQQQPEAVAWLRCDFCHQLGCAAPALQQQEGKGEAINAQTLADVDAAIDRWQGMHDTASEFSDEPETDRAEFAALLKHLRAYRSVLAPSPSTAVQQEAGSDTDRLDWLMRNISGADSRRLGIMTSAGVNRENLDAAIAAAPTQQPPSDQQQQEKQ